MCWINFLFVVWLILLCYVLLFYSVVCIIICFSCVLWFVRSFNYSSFLFVHIHSITESSFWFIMLSYLPFHFIISWLSCFFAGMLSTMSICYKVDMGLGILVGVAVTKAIYIAKFIRNFVQNTQLKTLGSTKLIGQNI